MDPQTTQILQLQVGMCQHPLLSNGVASFVLVEGAGLVVGAGFVEGPGSVDGARSVEGGGFVGDATAGSPTCRHTHLGLPQLLLPLHSQLNHLPKLTPLH